VQCKRVFQIPWSQSTFATFLVLLRGVFWEGGREGGKGGVKRERERERGEGLLLFPMCSYQIPNAFPNMFPIASHFI